VYMIERTFVLSCAYMVFFWLVEAFTKKDLVDGDFVFFCSIFCVL